MCVHVPVHLYVSACIYLCVCLHLCACRCVCMYLSTSVCLGPRSSAGGRFWEPELVLLLLLQLVTALMNI